MIKSLVYILFLSIFILSFQIFADVIPPNTHWYDNCVKIVNLDEYPDIYLIVFVTSPMFSGHETYIYKKDTCLTTGSRPYKANKIKILAAKKSYIDSVGLKNLQVQKVKVKISEKSEYYTEEIVDKNVFISDEEINPSGDFIDDKNPLVKQYTEYLIGGYANGKLNLYKSKQILEYNDGRPQKVITFSNPFKSKIIQELKLENTPSSKSVLISNPSPKIFQKVTKQPITSDERVKLIKKSLWRSLICLLKRLFGRSCQ
ncbi:MAG: hypothetical protein ACUVQP_12695 [Bacteroidales bacterium]